MTDHYAEAARELADPDSDPMLNACFAQAHATLALTDQVARIADALDPDVEETHTSEEWRAYAAYATKMAEGGGWTGREGAQLLDDAGRVWELQHDGWHHWTGNRWSYTAYDDLPDWAGSNFVGVTDKDRERVGLPHGEHHVRALDCQRQWCEFTHDPTPVDDGPDEALAQVRADNLDAFKHEAETPMRGHGECCDDPDEALARVLRAALPDRGVLEWDGISQIDRAEYLRMARAAREHIESEIPEDVERLTRERDALRWEVEQHMDGARRATNERDEWKAKHAALRRDVENTRNGWRRRGRGHVKALTDTAADQVQGALNRDAAREPWGTVGDREAMLDALDDAEQRNGPPPAVDWDTPEELSQKSINSFIESRTRQAGDDPDEALAKVAKDAFNGTHMAWDPNDSRSADWRDVARAAREHIDASRFAGAEHWRNLAEDAERERDEANSRAEAAEAKVDEWKAAAVAARTQQRTAITERDDWKGKAKRLNAMLSRTRDERDKYASRAERWAYRHAALRADVQARLDKWHETFMALPDATKKHADVLSDCADGLSDILARDDERAKEERR